MDELFFAYYVLELDYNVDPVGFARVVFHTILSVVLTTTLFAVLFFMRKKLKLKNKTLFILGVVIFTSQFLINMFLTKAYKDAAWPSVNEVQEYVCSEGIDKLNIDNIFGLNMSKVKSELDGKTIGSILTAYCSETNYPYKITGDANKEHKIPEGVEIPEGSSVILFQKEDIIIRFDGDHVVFDVDDSKTKKIL